MAMPMARRIALFLWMFFSLCMEGEPISCASLSTKCQGTQDMGSILAFNSYSLMGNEGITESAARFFMVGILHESYINGQYSR